MPQRFQVRVGDIFHTPADVLVVPCSTAGTVTSGIQTGLRQNNLPEPDFTLVPGEVRAIPLGEGKRWNVLCFAASVAGNRSSTDIINAIGSNLGRLATRDRRLHTVVPLLGAGAGGLNSTAAATALVKGFRETAPSEARLTITVLDEGVFERVREVITHGPVRREGTAATPDPRKPAVRQHDARKAVFISYSHRDQKWLEQLRDHLIPLQRDNEIEIWDDTRIRPGTDWRTEIRNAIDNAKVAILLVSAKFLASDYIAKNELPPLLQAAEEDGARILPIIVSPCRFDKVEKLARFQAVNDPNKPLTDLNGANRDRVFIKVADEVEAALRP